MTSTAPFVLACGDARREETYAALLGPERAHLLLTDPPYCLLTRRRRGGDLRDPKGRKVEREPSVRFETVREYRRFTQEWLALATRYLAPSARLIIWTNFLGKEPIATAAREFGYEHLLGELVWAKRGTQRTGSEQLLRVYETALVLSTEPARPLSPAERSLAWSVVAGYDDDGEAQVTGAHPHHKPYGVLEPLVRNFSAPRELVLDPFGGSGSVAAAALRLERRVAVVELVPEWAQQIEARLAAVLS